MTTKLVKAGTIKEGSYIIIEGIACRTVDSTHSKAGKHGAAKMRIMAVGLLDGRKREIVKPASDNVEVPIIDKRVAQVLTIAGTVANVMDMESYETIDLEIPEELKETVKEGAQIVYWDILGKKVMKQLKGGADG